MSVRKRLFSICLVSCIGGFPIIAQAAYEGEMTLQIHLEEDGEADTTGVFEIIPVAEVETLTTGPVFSYNDNFADCGVDLLQYETAAAAKSIAAYASANGISGEQYAVDDQGSVMADLPEGLYLISQINEEEDGEQVDPFLVSLPFWQEDSQTYSTYVVATPKTGSKSGTEGDTEIPKTPESTPTKTPSSKTESTPTSRSTKTVNTAAQTRPALYGILAACAGLAMWGLGVLRRKTEKSS